MGNLWPGLLRSLDDPRLALDNDATERALRGVGRKNHYGLRSERGTEVAALFHSVTESAELAGAEPDTYLRGAVRQALRGERISFPHELAATCASAHVAPRLESGPGEHLRRLSAANCRGYPGGAACFVSAGSAGGPSPFF